MKKNSKKEIILKEEKIYKFSEIQTLLFNKKDNEILIFQYNKGNKYSNSDKEIFLFDSFDYTYNILGYILMNNLYTKSKIWISTELNLSDDKLIDILDINTVLTENNISMPNENFCWKKIIWR